MLKLFSSRKWQPAPTRWKLHKLCQMNTYQSAMPGAMKETHSHMMTCLLYTQHKLQVGHVCHQKYYRAVSSKMQLILHLSHVGGREKTHEHLPDRIHWLSTKEYTNTPKHKSTFMGVLPPDKDWMSRITGSFTLTVTYAVTVICIVSLCTITNQWYQIWDHLPKNNITSKSHNEHI